MSFSITDGGNAPAINATRLRRQLVEQAIAAATAAEWENAAEINKRILEMGPDSEAENRLARTYWEMGELAKAREHYQSALALDPTNRIAERNINRLRMLMLEAGKKTVPAQAGSKAPVSIFVEETGKTGFAHLVDLVDPKQLAQVNPGDAVELSPDGPRLQAKSNGQHIGYVEPRVAARLLKLMAEGNKYAAGVTSIGERDVRMIVRETYQDPANYGKVSFPTAARVSDMRPYTKGTLVREEIDLEDDLEFDEDDDEIMDIGRVIPDDLTGDEAFVEEEPIEASDNDEDE
ncbi:MAG: tetratricopeptide repeat protein [Candidatus Limnocylindrales bacterium]